LMNALPFRHRDVVEYLVTKGADLDAKDKNGKTALMLAQEVFPEEDIVKLLHSVPVRRATE
jgi:ankyrin repeat protein